MIKKYIKNSLALLAEKFTKYCIHKGCITQDSVIEKFSAVVEVKTKHGDMRFFCPGEVPIWRANTFFEKEPETIEWIDSFEKNSIFFDVGANIGLYSIYAGMNNHNVSGIEPMVDNSFIFQKNIVLNNLKTTKSYCACFYDKNLIDTLKIRNTGFGQAENSFDEALGSFGEIYESQHEQGVIGITLDYFSEQVGFPNYIKIDVDGHELKVLKGATKTLSNPNLKSILIELNLELFSYKEISELIEQKGFILRSNKNSKMFEETKYQNIRNHIFTRP